MKHNWEHKKINDLGIIKSGYTPSSDDLATNGDFPYFKVAEMNLPGNEKYLIHSPSYLSGEIKTFPANSIVFPKNGAAVSTNKKRILQVDSVVDLNTAVMLANQNISVNYLYYILINIDFANLVKRGAVPTLNISELKNIIVPVPPFETQAQIVAELDKINEVIADCRELLRNLDALAQSLFYDTFGDIYLNPKNWKISTLGDVSEKISNGANTKIDLDTYKSEGIMFFRCQNVWRNHFDLSDVVYVNEETNSKMKGSVLKHNDLLVTKIGRLFTENSSLGRVALYEGEDGKANLSGNLSFIRLKPTVVPKFILYILISDYFRDYVRNTTSGGIDKRALNNSQLKALPIYIPPLAIQNQFAAQVERIEEQKKAVEITIAELQTLLDSRMDYWFN